MRWSSDTSSGRCAQACASRARVALQFAQGGSVRQVAHRLRVSVDTVRTHLKRISQYLGATRQAELAHLLLTQERAPCLPLPCGV